MCVCSISFLTGCVISHFKTLSPGVIEPEVSLFYIGMFTLAVRYANHNWKLFKFWMVVCL